MPYACSSRSRKGTRPTPAAVLDRASFTRERQSDVPSVPSTDLFVGYIETKARVSTQPALGTVTEEHARSMPGQGQGHASSRHGCSRLTHLPT
jgi:hypothetical protein